MNILNTVPPQEKEQNCEAHGPAFAYNAATRPHFRKWCNSKNSKFGSWMEPNLEVG